MENHNDVVVGFPSDIDSKTALSLLGILAFGAAAGYGIATAAKDIYNYLKSHMSKSSVHYHEVSNKSLIHNVQNSTQSSLDKILSNSDPNSFVNTIYNTLQGAYHNSVPHLMNAFTETTRYLHTLSSDSIVALATVGIGAGIAGFAAYKLRKSRA